MARKQKLLADQLRDAIKASDLTVNAISVKAGCYPASVLRFVKGERSISMDVAGKVAEVLGLELRPKE